MSPHPPCPACGADDALHLRGEYVHHAPRWLCWLTMVMHEYVTRSYICDHCGAAIDIGYVRAGRPRGG